MHYSSLRSSITSSISFQILRQIIWPEDGNPQIFINDRIWKHSFNCIYNNGRTWTHAIKCTPQKFLNTIEEVKVCTGVSGFFPLDLFLAEDYKDIEISIKGGEITELRSKNCTGFRGCKSCRLVFDRLYHRKLKEDNSKMQAAPQQADSIQKS